MFNRLRREISINWLKVTITVVALGLFLVRIIWPSFKIEGVDFGLIVLAILPWFSELIESAKFPGGWEIKFRDVQKAGSKITSNSPVSETKSDTSRDKPSFVVVAEHDANLALVGLRIEIEKRIRELARLHLVNLDLPLGRLLYEIIALDVLPVETANGLLKLVTLGNLAAHGARVEDTVAEWAVDVGPRILSVLDEHLTKLPARSSS